MIVILLVILVILLIISILIVTLRLVAVLAVLGPRPIEYSIVESSRVWYGMAWYITYYSIA